MNAQAPGFAEGTMMLLIVIMIRDMIRKGIGLWKAGTKRQLSRFICIFIFNTLGILPIIYLAFFQKQEKVGTVKTPSTEIKAPIKTIKAPVKTKTFKKK